MVLIIDAQTSGLAGNMFIGAFIDLGADEKK
ncbi:nickel insertion protein [Methanosphaera sp. WGK6]|nr:nickel insertion protein [Methanosphaera sp. WGK6]